MTPEEFILTTDYATLKNDDSGTFQLVVPGSMSVAAGGSYSNTSSITLGSNSVNTRSQINSSRSSTVWTAASQVDFTRTGTVLGVPTAYSLFTVISRTGTHTLQIAALIFNPNANTLTTQSGSETITFDIRTFLSPFN
jgi:hypothetical protein